MFSLKTAGAIAAVLAMGVTGCKGSHSSSSHSPSSNYHPPSGETSSAAQYPGFYELTREALPNTSATNTVTKTQKQQRITMAAPDHDSYTTDTDAFSTAFSVEQNYIGQVFNDAGTSGPVKSMYVLLAQANSKMSAINEFLIDSAGEPINCTPVLADDAVITPFFDTAVTSAFNEWDDSDQYTCYFAEENEVILFGHHSIESAPESCADPFEYYVMTGSSMDDEPNAEQVEIRGDSKDLAAIEKFYYNGCSGDLRLAFAHTTLYSAGVEFSSRSEILGNVHAHSFSVRSDFIDADTSYAHHITITGTGISRLAEASDAESAHFIMGYRADNCGNSSDSSTCVPGQQKTFCVRNSGVSNHYEMETDASQCASLESAFYTLTPLERSDIPAGFFDTSTTAFGL